MPAQIIVTSLPYITLSYTFKHEQILNMKANYDKIICYYQYTQYIIHPEY